MKKTNPMNANGTSLQSYLLAEYEQLVKVFGEPTYGPNDFNLDKVTCEWVLEYAENKFCTIYDWKTYETPMEKYDWHIGGIDDECIEVIQSYFERNR